MPPQPLVVRRGPLAAATIALALAMASCSCPGPNRREAGSAAPEEAAPIGDREGRFAGSNACRECHASEFKAWETSRHRATLAPAAGERLARLAEGPLRDGFSIDPVSGVVRGPGPDGTARTASAAYLVGGRHRDDLWVRLPDGSLQIFPFSYDLDAGAVFEPIAVLSGGTPPAPDAFEFWTRAGRSADRACYGCHATGHTLADAATAPPGAPAVRSRWAEDGVGCEACHGPGGPHIEAAKAGRATSARTRLSSAIEPSRQTDVCAGCHALRELLSSPVAATPAHRYGAAVQTFADPVASVPSSFEFRAATYADRRPATFQQEAAALSQSPCAVKAGLGCRDCHDVHAGTLTASMSGPDRGDRLCLSCHEAVGRDVRAHTRHDAASEGARCIACHMAAIVRGPGRTPARDHTLAPPVAGPGEIPAACVSCHAGSDRAKAETWPTWKTSARSSARRARFAAVTRELESGRNAAAALGGLVADRSNGWQLRSIAAADLYASFDRNPDRAATSILREATGDADPAVRRAVIRALGRSGDRSDLSRLAGLADDPDPFVALEAVVATGVIGDPGYAPRITKVVARHDLAGEYRAHLAFGRAALVTKDWARAEKAFARVVEIHPFVVSAWNDLGVARRSLGKADEARAAWERALAINPRFEAARRNLAESPPPR